MVVGGYLITAIHMRIADERGPINSQYIGPPDSQPNQGRLTSNAVRERCERVFKMVPKKMKNLVLVNSALSTFDYIQACVEVADKYSDNVIVIPPLLALSTFALEEVANFRNPPEKEVLLITTLAPEFFDFVILRRDRNFVLYVAEFEHFDVLDQFKEKFAKFYDYCLPHSTIFLAHETVYDFAKGFRNEFKPENCFVKQFKQWHYVLLYGGIIPPMIINIYYSPEYYELGYDLITKKFVPSRKKLTYANTFVSGTTEQVIGYVDERGIPYIADSAAIKNRVLPKTINTEEQSPKKNDPTEIAQNSSCDTTISSQPSSSSVNDSPQIKFIFHKNLCAIEVVQNGSSKFLTDSFDNKWTPLYLSMAESTVQIGEKAKSHFFTFPKHVIYDVLEVIGKPLNEIKINPKWGFELIEKDGIIYFQIETLSGPRLFSQEIVFAAFLKSMKILNQ
uniref:Uncharacterized protein n=1 Tax=Panagrolaimus davidi TaxID=227884 RepID=A0A914PE73_9BILA